MKTKVLILLCVLNLTILRLTAQEYIDSIPIYETFTLQSTHLVEQRSINVWLPPDYESSQGNYPVLYMLDGDIKEDFPHVANTFALLLKQKKIAPIILVGIENTQRRRKSFKLGSTKGPILK